MQNRTHGKAMSLRMTEDEHRFVLEKMQAVKRKNQTDFFLEVLRDKPIIVVEEIAAALAELKRQGSNLNQYITDERKAAYVSSQALDDNSGYAAQFLQTAQLFGKVTNFPIESIIT